MYRRSMSGKLKKVVMFMRLSIIIVAAIYLDLLKIQSDLKKILRSGFFAKVEIRTFFSVEIFFCRIFSFFLWRVLSTLTKY